MFQNVALSAVVIFLLVSSTAVANERKISIPDLENKAELSDSEILVLTEAVRSVFRDTHEVITISDGTYVDDPAQYEVTGSVMRFGDGYSAILNCNDRSRKTALVESIATVARVDDLLFKVTEAAKKIHAKLEGNTPTGISVPAEKEEAPPAEPAVHETQADPNTGVLTVTTSISFASVYLAGHYIGTTPISKRISPGSWRVATETGKYSSRDRVQVYAGDTTELWLTYNNHKSVKRIGHLLFWPGLAVSAVGLIPFIYMTTDASGPGNAFSVAGPIMWLLGGNAMILGPILWGVSRRMRRSQRDHIGSLKIEPNGTITF